MTLRLYDTLSRQLQEVLSPNDRTTMYCCGPTVYRDAHVGNLRTFLLADLISRTLVLSGVSVRLVQNITDVGHMSEDIASDDKMLAQAALEKIDPFEVARKYESKFHVDLHRLNVKAADAYPRASETIQLMQDLITTLINQGFAYVGEDKAVYFDAQSFESYGAISGNQLSSLKPGHRYEYAEDGVKKFHADWSLWKPAGSRTEMVWDSPWGKGFPGWHIECSAMSLDLLDNHINVHIGGIDLRFPHHENERAQSNAVSKNEAVDLWVHGEHLLFEGRKMSKSSGNVLLLQDVIDRGFDPLSIRLCFLENRYRSQMDLTWSAIAAADQTLKRWRKKMQTWGRSFEVLADNEIQAALFNDLDTPKALMRLREIEKNDQPEKREIFLFADQVLGLDLAREVETTELTAQMKQLLSDREIARAEKRWADSDALRLQLESLGLQINDTAQGQTWS